MSDTLTLRLDHRKKLTPDIVTEVIDLLEHTKSINTLQLHIRFKHHGSMIEANITDAESIVYSILENLSTSLTLETQQELIDFILTLKKPAHKKIGKMFPDSISYLATRLHWFYHTHKEQDDDTA